RVRVVAPHVDLRLFGVGGDDPLVLAEHGIDPGRGGAAIGQFLDNLREQAEAALQPAEPLRLQDLQDAGLVVFGDRLGRHVAAGASSIPSTMSSRYRSWPLLTNGAANARNSP